ncbi:DUF2950 family protein [Brenneria goodwinii]
MFIQFSLVFTPRSNLKTGVMHHFIIQQTEPVYDSHLGKHSAAVWLPFV